MGLTGYAVSMSQEWINFFTSNTYDLLLPLVVYTFGLAFYALFVWKFYNFLSKRDVFKLDLSKYEFSNHPNLRKAGSIFMYVVKHLIILPLFIFFWFLTLSALLIVMSKNQSVPEIMLLSMAIVSAIRITSYFKEDIAKDLAKILPFTLIGLILLDPTYFQSINVFDRITQLPDMALNVISYLLFTQILEFSLRILYGLKVLIFGSNE